MPGVRGSDQGSQQTWEQTQNKDMWIPKVTVMRCEMSHHILSEDDEYVEHACARQIDPNL